MVYLRRGQRVTDTSQVRGAVTRALARDPHDRAELLTALTRIPDLRAEIDALERAAIDAARAEGASWAAIAEALGLTSRQAAEQRRLRLDDPQRGRDAAKTRRRQIRQRTIDTPYVTELRSAVATVRNALDVGAEEHRTGPVALARRTAGFAATAPAGALIDLAHLVVDDLRNAALTPAAAEAVRRLRRVCQRKVDAYQD
jgi:hypothetical protein